MEFLPGFVRLEPLAGLSFAYFVCAFEVWAIGGLVGDDGKWAAFEAFVIAGLGNGAAVFVGEGQTTVPYGLKAVRAGSDGLELVFQFL